MKKGNKGLLKGVQIQGLKLGENDTLVIKYPVDEYGESIHPMEMLRINHNKIQEIVGCNVISLPSNYDILKISKEKLESNNS